MNKTGLKKGWIQILIYSVWKKTEYEYIRTAICQYKYEYLSQTGFLYLPFPSQSTGLVSGNSRSPLKPWESFLAFPFPSKIAKTNYL